MDFYLHICECCETPWCRHQNCQARFNNNNIVVKGKVFLPSISNTPAIVYLLSIHVDSVAWRNVANSLPWRCTFFFSFKSCATDIANCQISCQELPILRLFGLLAHMSQFLPSRFLGYSGFEVQTISFRMNQVWLIEHALKENVNWWKKTYFL